MFSPNRGQHAEGRLCILTASALDSCCSSPLWDAWLGFPTVIKHGPAWLVGGFPLAMEVSLGKSTINGGFINHKWSIYGIIPSCCRAIWPPFLEIWCAMISASDTTSRAAWAETLSIRGKWIGWREHGQEKTQKNRNVLFFPSHITYDNEFIHLDMSTRSSFF